MKKEKVKIPKEFYRIVHTIPYLVDDSKEVEIVISIDEKNDYKYSEVINALEETIKSIETMKDDI